MSEGLFWLIAVVVIITIVVGLINLAVQLIVAHLAISIPIIVLLIGGLIAFPFLEERHKDRQNQRYMEQRQKDQTASEKWTQDHIRSELRQAYDEALKRIREITGRDE